ncbi:hypothetical protein SAMN05428962_5002 [Paenibacillus sp. BC26]|nr:hypothetical protein SAMN05428962_5002 [Paenibacillus sp. BC26]
MFHIEASSEPREKNYETVINQREQFVQQLCEHL